MPASSRPILMPGVKLLGGTERRQAVSAAIKQSTFKPPRRSTRTRFRADGRMYTYINCALPRDHASGEIIAPLEASACGRGGCAHGYSHLMTPDRHGTICDECRLERMASEGAALQALLNIDLGWTRSSFDPLRVAQVLRAHERRIARRNALYRG